MSNVTSSGGAASAGGSATVIVGQRVKRGRADDFEHWQSSVNSAAATFAGFLATEVTRPVDEASDWTIKHRFDSIDHLNAWLGSPERRRLLDQGADTFESAASHVVLYDRWWNPAVEDQARDRAWRIGQERTVVSHRLACPGTVDERVEEVVAGKRHIADLVLPKSSSLADLDANQLRTALGLKPEALLTEEVV